MSLEPNSIEIRMLRSIIKSAILVCCFCWGVSASAFTLTGPRAPFQTALNPGGGYPALKSPQARDEEYRWNIPVVTYGFDQPFFNHFGTNGINTIQDAFRILNDLPPVSQISDQVLSNYFFQAEEVNQQAATLRVLDLKSYALGAIMGHFGLAEPEFWVWSLRSRFITPGSGLTNFVVYIRNFDPITRDPSRVINGTTYSYSVFGSSVSVLPTFSSTAASSITGLGRGLVSGAHGHSFWGLTYDDVGGIRHLYATNNFNNERVLPTLTLRSASAATGGSSVWSGPFSAVNGALAGGIWDGSYVSSGTNGTGGVTNDTTITNLFTGVDIAFRGGLDKVTFVRVNFDSILAQGFIGITNIYVDQFITNGVVRSQTVARQMFEPDIIFRAGDLGLATVYPELPFIGADVTVAQINNYDINSGGNPDGSGSGPINNGPGILVPGNEIHFSTILPYYWNVFIDGDDFGPNDSPETGTPNGYPGVFGTFDGSTIDAIYPVWMNLQLGDLEQLVRDSQGQL